MPRKSTPKRGAASLASSAPKERLTIVHVAIDSLHEDPANARRHGEKNRAAIQASLKEFGQVEPLVVMAGTGKVIGGNGRLAAMRELGWTEVGVVEFTGSETRAAALAIALNRSGELAEWDVDVLKATAEALKRDDFNLDAIGFTGDELDNLVASALAPVDGAEIGGKKSGKSADKQAADDPTSLPERFEVLVACSTEAVQVQLIEKLTADGFECRALIA